MVTDRKVFKGRKIENEKFIEIMEAYGTLLVDEQKYRAGNIMEKKKISGEILYDILRYKEIVPEDLQEMLVITQRISALESVCKGTLKMDLNEVLVDY